MELSDAIGVVGMACVFPDAGSPEELWQMVLAGRRAFRRLPDVRLPAEHYYAADPAVVDRTYCQLGAFITGWHFDPDSFRIPPVTVAATDPAHWMALSVAAQALADAGFDPTTATARQRARTGVFLGNTLCGDYGRSAYLSYRWPFVERALRQTLDHDADVDDATAERLVDRLRHRYLSPLPDITEDSLPGTMSNTIAGRICGYFDFGGGGYSTDGACASTLIAVASACDALAQGRLDMALAGGVDISIDPFELVGFARTGALGRDECRPYDRRAAGFLPGEGCGLLVLMRQEDALVADLSPRAVIRGWGLSSDGRGGITEPRREGQVRALRAAYRRAGYPLASVGLVEGHGTGTVRGDQVEISALQELLEHAPATADLRLGSIKGNIGHCKAAAGAAGLIKAVLALERRIRPPTAACDQPHSLFERCPTLTPITAGGPWPDGAPRRAGVSAFGFGGTNAHVTLEETEAGGEASTEDLALLASAQREELVLVASDEKKHLISELRKLASMAAPLSRAELTDLAATLSAARPSGRLRVAVAARSPWHLAELLEEAARELNRGGALRDINDPAGGLFAAVVPATPPNWVALFPGQGVPARSGRTVRHLAARYPEIRRFLSALDTQLVGEVPGGFAERLMAKSQNGTGLQTRSTELAQPLVAAASLATLEALRYAGLEPSLSLGHSLGEIGALAAAGAFEAEASVRVAALRGRVMARGLEGANGAMAAVAAGAEETLSLVEGAAARLELVNFNTPQQTVVAGPRAEVDSFVAECQRLRVACRRLPVSHAFHSKSLEPVVEPLRQALEQIDIDRPTGLVSSALGETMAPDEDIRAYLSRQVREPVRFEQAVRAAAEKEPAFWVDLGPGPVLAGFVRSILDTGAEVFITDPAAGDPHSHVQRVLGRAWTLGLSVDPARLYTYRFHRAFDLDQPTPDLLVNPCERLAPARDPNLAKELAPAFDEAPTEGARLETTDDQQEIVRFIQSWIVERTGYSSSVVKPDLRLRDDLNLDSIKATELIQTLIDRWNLPGWPGPSWGNSTLEELAGLTYSARHRSPEPGAASVVLPARLVGLEPGGDWVHRFPVETIPRPVSEELSVPLEAGSEVVILDEEGSLSVLLGAALRSEGLRVRVAEPRGALEGELDLLIWVVPPTLHLDPFLPAPEFERRLEEVAVRLLAQGKGLARCATRGRRPLWLVLCADGKTSDPGVADAPAALLKSVAAEYPDIRVRWLRTPQEFGPRRLVGIVLDELCCGGRQVVYRYDGAGVRTCHRASPAPVGVTEAAALGPGDVVLASGGARGITLELALALAQECGVDLALVGRSSDRHPAVIEAVKRCAAAGVRCHYWTCDVTNWSAVEYTVHAVRDRLGAIRGLLHGAGVTHPVPFIDLDAAGLVECVRVKALGLRNLLAALPPEGLKAVHLVSSVAGTTGMARQADYSFANAWLDGAAAELRRSHPDLHVCSLAYSVWKDVGMGADLGVVGVLAAQGVTGLSTRAGVDAYLGTLGPAPSSLQVVTGRLPPVSEALLFAPEPQPKSRFLETLLRSVPGTELVAEAAISDRRDLYLAHHVFAGTPLLPAVVGLDAMIAAAVACHGGGWPAIRELRLRQAIVVPRNAEIMVRVYALRDLASAEPRYRVALRTSIDDFTDDRFTADCVFELEESEAGGRLESPLPKRLPVDVAELTSELLFQGPLFRRITALRRFEPGTECLAEVTLPEDRGYWGDGTWTSGSFSTPYPAARDAFLQCLTLLAPGLDALPVAVRELRILRSLPAGSRVLCRARPRGDGFDIDVFDDRGDLVEYFHGIEVATAGPGAADSRQK